jgi:hypothetical protein
MCKIVVRWVSAASTMYKFIDDDGLLLMFLLMDLTRSVFCQYLIENFGFENVWAGIGTSIME